VTSIAQPFSEKTGWRRPARLQLSPGLNQAGVKGNRMSTDLSTTKADLGPDVRSALSQATQYVAANHGLSPQESWEWILQEAMAKRAGLVEVAQAIVAGETVAYRYDAPV
jgi:AmiR/NasT family two-component response regulator